MSDNRFDITFSDGTLQVLSDLTQSLDVSMAEVVRQALSIFSWLAKERASGSRLLIQRGSEVTELIIPSLERLRADAVPGPIRPPWSRDSAGGDASPRPRDSESDGHPSSAPA